MLRERSTSQDGGCWSAALLGRSVSINSGPTVVGLDLVTAVVRISSVGAMSSVDAMPCWWESCGNPPVRLHHSRIHESDCPVHPTCPCVANGDRGSSPNRMRSRISGQPAPSRARLGRAKCPIGTLSKGKRRAFATFFLFVSSASAIVPLYGSRRSLRSCSSAIALGGSPSAGPSVGINGTVRAHRSARFASKLAAHCVLGRVGVAGPGAARVQGQWPAGSRLQVFFPCAP